ncbi:MAG: phosphonopyruvate decarboxylase [Erysipelotrichales bacterium]|nr:phosphonopyruvate decarboxylase [Erysipelotrichales bacterium]
MIDTLEFYNYLLENSIDFFAGVPDSLLANLCACIKMNSPVEKNIITANEGNAVGMAAGYHLSTGKIGCVYMQNSGEGNIVNPLLSLVDEDVYSIPMLLIIGWRGEPGKHDEPQHVKQGKVTLQLLEAMGTKYVVLTDNYKEELQIAIEYMKSENKPYALIIQKGLFSSYKIEAEVSNYKLTREDALKEIIFNLNDDDIIVSTTGKTSREIFEIREANNHGHSNDFLTVGSMGHTSSIAYGVAIGTEKNVWCIDGDGSFIMHMGGLGVIGANIPSNFKYILNDNNAHESVGGQPTCSKTLDIPEIIKACGFKDVIVAETSEEIKLGIERLRNEVGVAMVLHTKQGSRDDLGRPTTTPQENKIALMKKLGVK